MKYIVYIPVKYKFLQNDLSLLIKKENLKKIFEVQYHFNYSLVFVKVKITYSTQEGWSHILRVLSFES